EVEPAHAGLGDEREAARADARELALRDGGEPRDLCAPHPTLADRGEPRERESRDRPAADERQAGHPDAVQPAVRDHAAEPGRDAVQLACPRPEDAEREAVHDEARVRVLLGLPEREVDAAHFAHARVAPVDAHAGPALGVADAEADAVHTEIEALR